MRIFLLNITGFLPNMTGFVLELLGFVLIMTGLVLNMTVFLLQKSLSPLKVIRVLHIKSRFFLNMTRGKTCILKSIQLFTNTICKFLQQIYDSQFHIQADMIKKGIIIIPIFGHSNPFKLEGLGPVDMWKQVNIVSKFQVPSSPMQIQRWHLFNLSNLVVQTIPQGIAQSLKNH